MATGNQPQKLEAKRNTKTHRTSKTPPSVWLKTKTGKPQNTAKTGKRNPQNTQRNKTGTTATRAHGQNKTGRGRNHKAPDNNRL